MMGLFNYSNDINMSTTIIINAHPAGDVRDPIFGNLSVEGSKAVTSSLHFWGPVSWILVYFLALVTDHAADLVIDLATFGRQ
ncbi:hypothetical protein RRG08_055663 [Elysia crispata]|uniref:Uncharacterized protein n=1 Tax=Elysia crispata TaxID=231223 RepID=A0AAE0Z7Y0_9GAST|nr:hypothetical protein RRG08_055663 [Elysia crispata]